MDQDFCCWRTAWLFVHTRGLQSCLNWRRHANSIRSAQLSTTGRRVLGSKRSSTPDAGIYYIPAFLLSADSALRILCSMAASAVLEQILALSFLRATSASYFSCLSRITQGALSKWQRTTLATLSLVFGLLGSWAIRGLLLSGCAVFPVASSAGTVHGNWLRLCGCLLDLLSKSSRTRGDSQSVIDLGSSTVPLA